MAQSSSPLKYPWDFMISPLYSRWILQPCGSWKKWTEDMPSFVWRPIDKIGGEIHSYPTTFSESPESFLSERQYCLLGLVFFTLNVYSQIPRVRQLSKCMFQGLISKSPHTSFTLHRFWNQNQNYFIELHLKTVEFSHPLEHK